MVLGENNMPLYTQSIKNLKGGISQQPDILRYQDQGEEQVNCWSSESDGLQKRPPTVFKKRLTNSQDELGEYPKFHLINRDSFEQYYIVFTGKDIKVFDLVGKQYTVKGVMDYVMTDTPRDDIRVITVADYTFIVNRNKVVRAGEEEAYPDYDSEKRGLINLRGGQYGRTLKVGINGGAMVEHKLPSGSNVESDPPKIDAQYIGAELIKLLEAEDEYSNFEFRLGSGYIVVEGKGDQKVESIETEDGYANQLISGILDTVQVVSKLPLAAPSGYIIKIQGETNSTADEYFVRYDHKTKTWKETIEPHVIKDMDKSTMPHALIRQEDGSFEFKPMEWGQRGAGNDETNPMPSFVDSTINDVFFYRNRLGFLSGENVIMSRSGRYFSFFPKSVATLSDDDPIDVAVSHPRISILKYAVPFSEQLLLWSDEVQFVLSSAGVLTSKSIQLDVGSEFALGDNARPFAVGRSVYFSSPRGTFTSIKRYFSVQEVSDVKDADDTTGHVLSYIPNGVFDIQGSSTENFLTVNTTGDYNKLFVYKFLFKDGEQLQASWSHWEFPKGTEILASASIGSTIYIVKRHANGTDLVTLKFIKESTDYLDEPYRIHIDDKIEATLPKESYDVDNYETTLDIYSIWQKERPQLGEYLLVDSKGRYADLGTIGSETTSLKLKGNWTGVKVFIGLKYEMSYKFSRFLIKYEDKDGTVTEDTGRLQLRRAWINYQDTGALDILITNSNQNYKYTLNGYRLGDQKIAEVNIGDGQYRFPMNGDARKTHLQITSSYPSPVSIVGCGWEASYSKKAQRI